MWPLGNSIVGEQYKAGYVPPEMAQRRTRLPVCKDQSLFRVQCCPVTPEDPPERLNAIREVHPANGIGLLAEVEGQFHHEQL